MEFLHGVNISAAKSGTHMRKNFNMNYKEPTIGVSFRTTTIVSLLY